MSLFFKEVPGVCKIAGPGSMIMACHDHFSLPEVWIISWLPQALFIGREFLLIICTP